MKSYKIAWRKFIHYLIFIGIPVIGLTILLFYLPRLNPFKNYEIILFMIINIFAEFLVVQLPSGIQVSLSYPVNICILILFGPVATMWTYLPGIIIRHLFENKDAFKVFFNVGQLSITIYLTSLLLPADHSQILLINDFFWLLMVALFFDLSNFSFVAMFISSKGECGFFEAFRDIWFKEMVTALPLYYAAGLIMDICYQS